MRVLHKAELAIRVAAAFMQARRQRFKSRAELERWQDRRVQAHLRYVISRSEYHRELYDGQDLTDWRRFPVTDKRAMMANFDAYNTLGIGREEAMRVASLAEKTRDYRPSLQGATVGLSSGTSGNYSLFLSTRRENGLFIGTALGRLLRGSPFSEHRIAFFHRAHSNVYQGLDSGRMKHRFFDLSIPMEQHYATLNALKPTHVIAPPLALRDLGAAKKRGKLSICPSAILSVAEVLSCDDRQRIESDFELKLDEAYIATEGFIAATCAYGSLHVNEDCVVMQREWLDQTTGRFVPVITDFRRRAQPIIRYRLEDVLVDGPSSCACGSPFAVLKQVEGRCDDILVFQCANTREARNVFPDYVRRSVGFASDHIRDYRVVQESMDKLMLAIDVDQEHREMSERLIREALGKLFARFAVLAPTVAFESTFPSQCTGKRRRVVRGFETSLPSDFGRRS